VRKLDGESRWQDLHLIVESQEDLAQAPGWRQPKDQDIAEAKALMAAAGYADGVKAMLNLVTGPSVRIGEVVAEQLRKSLGLEFTLEAVDRATTVDRILRGTHHASLDSSGVIILDPAALRHSRESGNPGDKRHEDWMPACAGMTFYWRRTYETDI
jgi:ABC-type transport system substrate-binding protein